MASIMIKTINSTTINLSSLFNGALSTENEINWGDSVSNKLTYHTFNSANTYNIDLGDNYIANIGDNLSFPNTNYLKFIDFEYFNINIGNNFLSNNSALDYLDMSSLNVNSIGSNFLNNCSLKIIKLPYKTGTTLVSWGSNFLEQDGKIFCGIFDTYYKTTSPWSIYSNKMYNVEFAYNLVTEQDIKLSTIGKFPIYNVGYLDLNNLPKLKAAITNRSILLENQYTEYVNPNTKQIYYKNIDIRKSYFIYSFKYRFSYDRGITFSNSFIYNRYFKALRVENNKLYVQNFSDNTYFYLKSNESNIDFSQKNEKYRARDILTNFSDSNYIESLRYKLHEFVDKKDPNYAMGKLKFGILDDTLIKSLSYDGDVETGFIIRIVAIGACKNPVIHSALNNRPFIKINYSTILGDIITINTKIGHKSAYLLRNGETINIMKYIDISSTWLTIKHGENPFYITADPDDGSIYNLKISVIYNDLYVGI